MGHIVIRHLSGSRANQEDRFPLKGFEEITLGRHTSSSVIFSDETDAMVGRRHARITRNPALTSLFFITDLGSRNGTFVNRHRIFGAATLNSGDVVQFGVGGPEFRFDVESEPDRLHIDAPPPLPANPFKQVGAQAGAAEARVSNVPAEAPTRKRPPVVGVVLIGIIAIGAGYAGYQGIQAYKSPAVVKPGGTAEENTALEASLEKYDHVHLSGDASEAENDAQRTAWLIDVAPYRMLGSGRPGAAAFDFDKPAGLAFSPTGLLFAVDAGNRRIQIWDVKTGARVTEFGHDVFGGAIAGIAIARDNQILVTDQARGLAYAFAPPELVTGRPLGPRDYRFKGLRFGDQGFTKLGAVAIDSKGRAYVVNANGNDVLRFNLDGSPDKTWNFEKTRADGDTYLRGCDGIAIDEAGGDLFVASEKDAVVEVFDWETGAYKNRTVGVSKDASGKPSGKRVFFGSVRGMAVAQGRLLAVDESAGHIQIFNLALPDAFNTDLEGYAAPQPTRSAGYQGYFGRAPLVDFEDKTDTELQRKVESGAIIPGRANPPGHFCSPSSIASHTDPASGETYIAIADRCNYRIAVYLWSDIAKAMGIAETTANAAPKTNEAEVEKTAAVTANAPTTIKSNTAPGRVQPTKAISSGRVTRAGNVRKTFRPLNTASKAKTGPKGASTAVASSGKKKQAADKYNDPTIDGKKAKKAKKAKKVKKPKY